MSENSAGLPMNGELLGQFTGQRIYEGAQGAQQAVATPSETVESYALSLMKRHCIATERLARIAFDKTHPVDEYISTPGAPANGIIILQPTYWMPERIESILACIPAEVDSALLQLGDRYIQLLDNTEDVNTVSAHGQATTPAATQTIASIAAAQLPAGTYTVTGSVFIDGTAVAATDDDNMTVDVGGSVFARLNVNSVGGFAPFGPWTVTLNGSQTLSVVTVGAGTSGSIYHAQISAVELQSTEQTSPNVVNLQNLGIILNQDDNRILTLSPVPVTGPVHIELMGYADEIYGNA
jgi:hypothetical protein